MSFLTVFTRQRHHSQRSEAREHFTGGRRGQDIDQGDRLWTVKVRGCEHNDEDLLRDSDIPGARDSGDCRSG